MEDMFISDEAWEKDFEKATKMIPHYSDFSGEVSKDKEKLIEYFNFNDEINLLVERLYVYSNQKYHQDMAEAKYQAYSGKAQKLAVDIGSASAFLNRKFWKWRKIHYFHGCRMTGWPITGDMWEKY